LVVAASHGGLSDNRSQRTEWFVAFGEITGCRVWLVLFSLLVVVIRPWGNLKTGYFYRKPVDFFLEEVSPLADHA
jgi:hypothetical protein